MPKVTFAKQFKFSPDGIAVDTYEPGEHDVSARCAQVAKAAGVLAEKAPAKTEKPLPETDKA
ncbi:MAG: hypothetical protein LDL44_00605 [Caenispirillum sp.]|nr:hypothetical protein [Caenispirillum sp.]